MLNYNTQHKRGHIPRKYRPDKQMTKQFSKTPDRQSMQQHIHRSAKTNYGNNRWQHGQKYLRVFSAN